MLEPAKPMTQLLQDTGVAWRDKDSVCGPATQSERAKAEESGGRAAEKEACVVRENIRRAGWWMSEGTRGTASVRALCYSDRA
jgi:ribosomal protein L15E